MLCIKVSRGQDGTCHTGECNQTPPQLWFSKSPRKKPKPTSLAGGFSKSREPNRPLPGKTISKMVDEILYRSINEENNQEVLEGILLPWNLRTTWGKENNL